MKSISNKARQAFRQWGANGGRRRAKSLSASKRQAISQLAARARWSKKRGEKSAMPSVRLQGAPWDNPAYLEEVLLYGSVDDWKELYRIITDHPFGAEALALEKVLDATEIYGATHLWRGIFNHLRGAFS